MLLNKLEKVESRYEEILESLSQKEVIDNRDKFQKLSKELSGLEEIVKTFKDYKSALKQIEETKSMLNDPEMSALAASELKELVEKEKALKDRIEMLLLPSDPMDDKNTIVEIRGGTGGDEAALFAGDLSRMYLRYAEKKGWKTEMIDSNPTGLGGYKEVEIGRAHV